MVREAPENWEARLGLIEALLDDGQRDAAEQLLEERSNLPDDPEQRLKAGRARGLLDPEEGLEVISEILEKEPTNAAAHFEKALICQKTGDLESARKHYFTAVTFDASQADDSIASELVGKDGNGKPDPSQLQLQPVPTSPIPVETAIQPTPGLNPAAVLPAAQMPIPTASTPVTEAFPYFPAPAPASTAPIFPPQTVEPIAEAPAKSRSSTVVVRKKPRTGGKKVVSVFVGLIGIAILCTIAWLIAVMPARKDEPQILAQMIGPRENETEIEKKKKEVATQASAASASAAAGSVTAMVRSQTTAAIAVPEVSTVSSGPLGLGEGQFGVGDGMGSGSSAFGEGMITSIGARCNAGERRRRLASAGAGPKTEEAVVNALRFLAKRQKPDGSFSNEFPVAMTGLSLLAFLGHCETPSSEEFGPVVTKAALYLMEAAKRNPRSSIQSPKGGRPSYENAIATYALAELYSVAKTDGSASRIPGLESAIRQGVQQITRSQDSSGGWNYRYERRGGGDTSVSGWNFQALKAAYNTGMMINGVNSALDKGLKYFKHAQSDDGGFAYRPRSNPRTKPTLVGVGALAFVMWDNNEDGVRDLAFQWLDKHAFGNGQVNIYSWYYVTQALFMIGGDSWKKWNSRAMPKILGAQKPDGSFGIQAAHGPKDPVYATALCTLALEVYYRYLPTSDKVGR